MITTGQIDLGERNVLDLRFTHFKTRKWGILVIGTWLLDEDEDPCLVLIDAKAHAAKREVVPCIIPLRNAWMWTEEHGNPAFVWSTISEWMHAGHLPGSIVNQQDLFKVYDAVLTRLRDMIMMPPMPAALAATIHGTAPETIGELTLTDQSTGAVLHEAELKAHVRH